MSLSLSLNTALTGLNVNQQSLAVLSQNIANANTAGYSRQLINQQSVSLDGMGSGVRIEDVTRRIDNYLNNAIKSQNSTVGMTGVLNDYAGRIQILFGQPGSSNSIDSYVNLFFNNIRSLAQTPEDTTLQRSTVNTAVTLAGQIQGLATSLQDLQYEADQDIARSVTQVNSDLKALHTVNESIVNARALGRDTADLEDQRDRLIKSVSESISLTTYNRENGAIHLVSSSGIPLLDENVYQLSYTPVVSSASFSNNAQLPPISVQRLSPDGVPVGPTYDLVSSGPVGTAKSFLGSGKLQGLVQMRDTQIPNIINELDMLASTLTNKFNEIHNMGSGFPGANSFTGTRAVNGGDYSVWSGSTRIAVLGPDGKPLQSPYPDETGVLPLTIDFSKLPTKNGTGNPTTQEILNEINQYYGVPQPKVEVGNMNNIRLVSNSPSIPGNPAQLAFDFDLNNISGLPANFFVTGVSVLDNLGVSTGGVTNNIPSIALDSGAPNPTYSTTAGSTTVTINTTGISNGLVNGQTVYLSNPGVPVNGIPAAELGGYFTIKNVTATSFEIDVATQATATSGVNVASQTVQPPYTTADPGTNTRTLSNGSFIADLSGNSSAPYYTVNVSVGVDDGQGNIKTAVISYRVNNGQTQTLNSRFSAVSATGQAEIVQPTSNTPILTAMLVDDKGVELPKSGFTYTTQENGYLKLVAGNSTSVVAIDSLDSAQLGKPNDNPPQAGTGRGFSYYFELNNFFKSNKPTVTGGTLAGSAFNLQVEQRIQNNPSLLSLGSLVRVTQPTDPDADPLYTYQRNIGDNSIIQRLSDLGLGTTLFGSAGGLSQTTQSFSSYAAQIIGATATNAVTSKTDATNAQTLMDGFTQRSSSISGVNLDTELANTVIYQNAYSASARVITVTSELFDTLIQMVR
jgi:flagellar hook-associated protein 1 FlgK